MEDDCSEGKIKGRMQEVNCYIPCWLKAVTIPFYLSGNHCILLLCLFLCLYKCNVFKEFRECLGAGAWGGRGDKCGKEEQEGKKIPAWKFLSQLGGSYYTIANARRPFLFGTPEVY